MKNVSKAFVPVLATALAMAVGTQAGLAQQAAARTPRAVVCCQPDVRVATFGDNIYGSDGTNQVKKVKIAAGKSLIVHFQVENDGTPQDTPTVQSAAGAGVFHVTYINEFDVNVTPDMESGYGPGTYYPTAWFGFRMNIKIAKSAKQGKTHDFLINASSGATPSLVDALIVRATVK
jgi:hypothetical protein